MTVGVLESFVGGLIVLPISLIFMGHAISIDLSPERLPLLVLVLLLTAFASAAMGLLVGTIIKPSRVSHACCFFGKHLLYLAPAGAPSCHAGYNAHRSLDLDQ